MEFVIFLMIVVVIFVLSGIKIVNQYERGVVLTFGLFTGVCQPGLRIVVPVIQRMIRLY